MSLTARVERSAFSAVKSSGGRAEPLSRRFKELAAKPRVGGADVSALIYAVLDDIARLGVVAPAVDKSMQQLLLQPNVDSSAQDILQQRWFVPLAAPTEVKDLKTAIAAGPEALDGKAAQKLLILLSAGGAPRRESLRYLQGLVDGGTMDKKAEQALRQGLLKQFVAAMDALGTAPKIETELAHDVARMSKAHPGSQELQIAVEDLYLRGSGERKDLSKLSGALAQVPALSESEWDLAIAVVSDPEATIDVAGLRKILTIIGLDGRVSARERRVLARIQTMNKTEQADALLSQWNDYGLPSRMRTQIGRLVGTDALSLVGAAGAAAVQAAVAHCDDFENLVAVTTALETTDRLRESLGLPEVITADAQARITNRLVEYLQAGSSSVERLLLGILGDIRGSVERVVLAARGQGQLQFEQDAKLPAAGSFFPLQAVFSDEYACVRGATDEDEDVVYSLHLPSGQVKKVFLEKGTDSMSITPQMTFVGNTLYVGGSDDDGRFAAVGSYAPSTDTLERLAALPEGYAILSMFPRDGQLTVVAGPAGETQRQAGRTPPASSQQFVGEGDLQLPDVQSVTSKIEVTGAGTVSDVWLRLEIDHECPSDLVFTLVAPQNGARIELPMDLLEDLPSHGWFKISSEDLSPLMGLDRSGTWSLEIEDGASGDEGWLQSCSLAFADLATDSASDDSPDALNTPVAFTLQSDGTWAAPTKLGDGVPPGSAVGVHLDANRFVLAGVPDESSWGDTSEDAPGLPIVICDTKSGEVEQLPGIDQWMAIPKTLWVDGPKLWLAGQSWDDEAETFQAWMAVLDLENKADGWEVIDTASSLFAKVGDDIKVSKFPRYSAGAGINQGRKDSAGVDEVIGRPVALSAGLRRRQDLLLADVGALRSDGIEQAAPLTRPGLERLFDMADDLAAQDGLTPSITASIDQLVGMLPADDDAVLLVMSRWYATGLSMVSSAERAAATKKLLHAPVSSSLQGLSAEIAMMGADPKGVETLLRLSLSTDKTNKASRKIINECMLLLLERDTDALLNEQALKSEAVERFTRVAAGVRTQGRRARSRVDRMVKRLLFLGHHSGDSSDPIRTMVANGMQLSPMELRLGLTKLARTGGDMNLADMRALATAVDGDWGRRVDETNLLTRLRSLKLSPAARSKLTALLAGVTVPRDLEGEELAGGMGKVDGTGKLVVWAAENATASNQAIVSVGIKNPVETGDDGVRTKGVHVSGQRVLKTADGHEPHVRGAKVTDDAFDQVQVLWTANHVLSSLRRVGIDVTALQRDNSNDGVVRIMANIMPEMNAFYSPDDNHIMLGTSEEKWHLASDGDVVAHEIGHYVLDHLNPDMTYWGDPGGIHEGFADLTAGLLFNDPEVSEDFGKFEAGAVGMREGSFLRTLENDLTIDDVSDEPHARGELFGGYGWSCKEALAKIIGDDDEAASTMYAIVAKHPFFYASSAPSAADFIAAILASARRVFAKNPAVMVKVVRAFRDEAVRRRMVDKSWTEPAMGDSQLERTLTKSLAPLGRVTTSLPAVSKVVDAIEACGLIETPPGVRFVTRRTLRTGSIQKIVMQAVATDPESGREQVVEDGYLCITTDGGRVIRAAGGATHLAKTIDWKELSGGESARVEATSRVRQYIRGDFKRRLSLRGLEKHFGDDALKAKSEKVEEVIYRGRRALRVSNAVGTFLVDPADSSVTAKRTIFV